MTKPTALIIEDDPKLAKIFSEALKMSDFAIEIFHQGDLALKWLATATPDIIILDIHLPYLSGRDILAGIRTKPHLAQSRIIVVTADLFEAEDLQGQVDQVLMKPISFQRLHRVVEQLLAPEQSS
ncbi:MAG: response regulator [Anaerolineae bacterium]|nr:response regulator [Anaerolineae bacterium]